MDLLNFGEDFAAVYSRSNSVIPASTHGLSGLIAACQKRVDRLESVVHTHLELLERGLEGRRLIKPAFERIGRLADLKRANRARGAFQSVGQLGAIGRPRCALRDT